ncbi:MAG: efflux RND transporter periplasmic adaptor subunit [Phycisphaerales bacterium]|nr:efflux RND transporter periplasmic adaptor subunit [Phycisphaerales bacterium]
MARWLRRILFVLLLVAGIGYLLYARWFRPIPATGFEVNSSTLVIEMMGTGTVEARTSTVVSAKIQGRLRTLAIDQGEHVEAGQVVASLDDSDLARQVEIAQANVEAAEAGLDRLRADRTRTDAVLRRVQREDERIRDAFDRGAANDTEIDNSVEQVAVAQADSARAEAAIAEGQKLLIVARKTLGYQQARLDDTVIRAPFDGLIVRRDRDPGDIVVPGSSIYHVIALEEIWVSAWVDETAMAALAPDQPARVVLRSEPDHPYPGHVVRLGRETDRETREFIVDVAIERLPKQWAIGQRAEVYIETARIEDVLIMPLTFVAVVEGQRGVLLHHDGRAVWTPCDFGTRGREMIEVREGIDSGDVLVRLADPAPRVELSDGRRIRIE